MAKSKTRRAQADLLRGVETNRPFPRLRLADFQWKEVCKLSGIPEDEDEARKSIESALGMFRHFEESDLHRGSAADIRQELRSLAEDASSLYKRLSQLMDNPQAYVALAGEVMSSAPHDRLIDVADQKGCSSSVFPQGEMEDGHHRASRMCDVLLHARKWFLTAAHRIKAEKRGPKAKNVYWLIGNLSRIREHLTGKKIIRSHKDPSSLEYLKYVCKIADPAIGNGTIIEAIKKHGK